MSTNYYQYRGQGIEGEHIGKTYYRPRGTSSTVFIWAENPDLIHNTCLEHPSAQMFIDEYGKVLTCQEMKAIFDNAAWDVKSIGEEFS